MELTDFFAAWDAKPWAWGEVDCCTVLAAWAAARGHADLLAPIRGGYHDEAEAHEILRQYRGVMGLIAAGALRLRLRPVAWAAECPPIGAIGVIGSSHNILRQWGAIWNGRWMVRGTDCFGPVSAPVLGAWSV